MISANLILGFLGVGKTTLIKQLLANKPADERWAVLVNEFGEIGIDGGLLRSDEVAVEEIPGGCMCCSVAPPSRKALKRLIEEQRPDRIIIEPTGLAEPQQILKILQSEEFNDLLELKAVIGLVDPWCLTQAEFVQMPLFAQQLAAADLVIATKGDISSTEALEAYQQFCQQQQLTATVVSNGNLDPSLLDQAKGHRASQSTQCTGHHHHHSHAERETITEDGITRFESRDQHASSCGWNFLQIQCLISKNLPNYLRSSISLA